jgi:hypothetical protein
LIIHTILDIQTSIKAFAHKEHNHLELHAKVERVPEEPKTPDYEVKVC